MGQRSRKEPKNPAQDHIPRKGWSHVALYILCVRVCVCVCVCQRSTITRGWHTLCDYKLVNFQFAYETINHISVIGQIFY